MAQSRHDVDPFIALPMVTNVFKRKDSGELQHTGFTCAWIRWVPDENETEKLDPPLAMIELFIDDVAYTFEVMGLHMVLQTAMKHYRRERRRRDKEDAPKN